MAVCTPSATLEQPLTRDRFYRRAELAHPYGHGVYLTIAVDDVRKLHVAVLAGGYELFLPLEERWYDRGADGVGARQFAVQDPDGYLLRLSQHLGPHPR